MAKNKTTQIAIPLTVLNTLGLVGPFTSGTLPASISGYQVDFINDSSWPSSGDVIKITVDLSNDNGQSWQFDASITFSGGTWRARGGAATNTSEWDVSISQASPTRKVRFTLDVFQVCTLGATLSSF